MFLQLKNTIFKARKHELFWLLLFCFTIRNFIFQFRHVLLYNADTVTYYYAAQNIFNGLIDGARTPVYPMFIKIFEWIWPESLFLKLVYFQHVISFVSIIPFYLICKKWLRYRWIVIGASVIWGCLPPVLQNNNALFAESLFISSLVWFVFLLSQFINKPTIKGVIIIHSFLFLLIMIKPVALVFYGSIGMFWIVNLWLCNYKRFLKSIIISFSLSVILLFSYCTLNQIQNGRWCITTVSHDNTFVNVILSGAYKSLTDDIFTTAIDTTFRKDHYFTVFYLNNDHDKYQKAFKNFPLEYMSHWDMKSVYELPTNTLGYNVTNVSKYLNQAIKTKEYVSYILRKPIRFSNFTLLYCKGIVFYILMFIEFGLILYWFVKKRRIVQLRFLNLLMIIFFLLGFFIGGVTDGTYGRVLLPLSPFFILMTFFILDSSFHFMYSIYKKL